MSTSFYLHPLHPICRRPGCDRPATHRVLDEAGVPVSPRLCAIHARHWKRRLDTRPSDAQPDPST